MTLEPLGEIAGVDSRYIGGFIGLADQSNRALDETYVVANLAAFQDTETVFIGEALGHMSADAGIRESYSQQMGGTSFPVLGRCFQTDCSSLADRFGGLENLSLDVLGGQWNQSFWDVSLNPPELLWVQDLESD